MLFRVALILVLWCAPLAMADDDPYAWEPITENDWNVTADSTHDAVVIFEKYVIDDRDINNSECYHDVYRRIRILNKNGRSWGDVEVPILESDQKIESIQARAIQRDGKAVFITPENIFEKEALKVDKFKVKQTTFSIPGISDDCIIEYHIRIKISDYSGVWIPQQEIPVLLAELRWHIMPPAIASFLLQYLGSDNVNSSAIPNYLWTGPKGNIRITLLPEDDKTDEIYFKVTNLEPFKSEPYSFPEKSLRAKLICYYGNSLSPARYWTAHADNLGKAMQSACEKDKRAKEIVKQFAHLATDEEKIEAAYRWVQDSLLNLSYFDLYTIKKGKKTKQTPKDASTVEDVLKHRYGSFFHIDLVFYNFLRLMNINAKMAMAVSRDDNLFTMKAKYWQFNEFLVAVKVDDSTYKYYCPGYPNCPVNMIPWELEGITIFVTESDMNFYQSFFSRLNDNKVLVSYQYNIDENFQLSGKAQTRMTGQPARIYRDIALRNEDSLAVESAYQNNIEENMYPDAAKIENVELINLKDNRERFGLSFDLTFPELIPQGNRLFIKPIEYFDRLKNDFTDETRTHDILLPYAYVQTESAQITFPENLELEALPNDTTFSNYAGSVAVQYQHIGNLLSIVRKFDLNSPYWSVADYPAIRELFEARLNLANEIIILKEIE